MKKYMFKITCELNGIQASILNAWGMGVVCQLISFELVWCRSLNVVSHRKKR